MKRSDTINLTEIRDEVIRIENTLTMLANAADLLAVTDDDTFARISDSLANARRYVGEAEDDLRSACIYHKD